MELPLHTDPLISDDRLAPRFKTSHEADCGLVSIHDQLGQIGQCITYTSDDPLAVEIGCAVEIACSGLYLETN